MRCTKGLLLGITILATSAIAARADINVVASIKPVHSLVAGVMNGVAEPGLIVEGAGSPHTYALKPSKAAMLEQANVVFWVGPELEAFLQKPLETLTSKATSVALLEADQLTKLDVREGGAFEAHDHHDDEGHHHGAKASHDHDHGHEKKKAAAHDDHDHHHKAADKDHHHHHDHHDFDAHVWLDPVNAKVLIGEIKAALIEADPSNAAKYEANAAGMITDLDTLMADIAAELKPLQGKGFIVFHDAYQYFEKRFGLAASGSITVSPEVMPGARRISELRGKVRDLGVACVFSEPQFEPKLVATVTEGTSAKSGVLDPLGAALQDGPQLYGQLIRNMATSFKTCLTEAS